jgi:hypothetical protein
VGSRGGNVKNLKFAQSGVSRFLLIQVDSQAEPQTHCPNQSKQKLLKMSGQVCIESTTYKKNRSAVSGFGGARSVQRSQRRDVELHNAAFKPVEVP